MSDQPIDGADLGGELEPDPGCSWCERASGMVLIGGAVGLLYIGIDLVTGGWLSRLFVSSVTRAADAIDPDGAPAATEAGAGELTGDAP